jgi:hypothetical protein
MYYDKTARITYVLIKLWSYGPALRLGPDSFLVEHGSCRRYAMTTVNLYRGKPTLVDVDNSYLQAMQSTDDSIG